ncbi:MAG TPA: hypothetical protein VF549_06050 [Solirubrobacteraceae bacterium]|jgi:hypothetical protein
MSEPQVEPPAADVRSFLPRPGEPVEDYAARLRALHDDLSLVLDAVERGLAAADAEPALRPEPLEVVSEPHRSPPPPRPLSSAPRGSARVEVISTPAGAAGAGAGGERAWSGPPEPEGHAPWGGRRASMGEGAPAGGGPAAPSPERFEERRGVAEPWVERPPRPPREEPWVEQRGEEPWAAGAPADPWAAADRAAPWREPPPWTERRPSAWPPPPPPPAEMTFEPPAHAPFAVPPRRRQPSLPPVAIAAALLGWLVAIALVIALAFGL